MDVREGFTHEDWALVMQGPLVAAYAITAADPSGLVGRVQEATAAARAIQDAEGPTEQHDLVSHVVRGYRSSDTQKEIGSAIAEMARGKRHDEATEAALERLRRIGWAVEDAAPDEAAAYKDWLREVARRVAEAAKEGGFLGIGGEAVSAAETRTLADIDAALSAPETPDGDGRMPV